MNVFYKKGYLIAVYDENDNLHAVCDNSREFAEKFDKSMDVAKSIIYRVSSGKQNTFIHNHKRLSLSLIPLDVNEIQDLLAE